MAFKVADRVRETTTTTGTGSITLAGAVFGYQSFADALSVNDTCWYAIQGGTQWEIGIGTLMASATLARTTVLQSSNGDALVNFSAGVKDVFCTLPATALLGMLTGNAGAAAPAPAIRGTRWLDTSVANTAVYKIFDGSDWNTVFTINETTGTVAFGTITVGTATSGAHALNRATADGRYVQPSALNSYAALAGATFTGALSATAGFSAVGGTITLQAGTAYTDTVTVNSRLSVTTDAALEGLRINRTNVPTPTSNFCIFQTAGTTRGSIQYNSTSAQTVFATTSDGRLKPLRRSFDPGPILDALEVVHHNWIHDETVWAYGVIAQDAYRVFPQAVVPGRGKPGRKKFRPWQVDYSKFVPLLLREMQLLRSRVADLEGR